MLTIPTLLVLAPAACGEPPPPVPPPPPAPSASAPPPATVASASPPPRPAPPPLPAYENPGGMWMPHQIKAHEAKLKELGLAIDPKLLEDPLSSVLGAVVSLGGCSASFVSDEGLVATNHHCAVGALQYNSTPESNLMKKGFLAKTRADEKNNGPTARVLVTQAVVDVTDEVRGPLAKIKDDRARFKAIEGKTKDLVAACEKGRPGVRCTVASFYEGARYYRIEQLEIRDVRLVYAPPEGAGNYGGEIDNWRWPRHTADFSMFRAYVGPDGKPADFATGNVPYKPPHRLKLATSGLKQGDLVFVAGYPGRTQSLKTADEVEDAVTYSYPRRKQLFEEYLALTDKLSAADKDVAIKAAPLSRGFNNALTNTKGQLEGLVQGGLLAEKKQQKEKLQAFIDADPERKKKWGATLSELKKLHAEVEKHREADAQLRVEIPLARLVDSALTIVRMAEEREKADKDRHPDFQERNWPRREQELVATQKRYAKTLDKEVLKLALSRALKHPASERTGAIEIIAGQKPTSQSITFAVGELYDGTKLDDEKLRVELFKTAKLADLKKSTDTQIKLALKLRPLFKESEEREERVSGRLAALKPLYFEALAALEGKELAPDANGTLRITYGTVRGYTPPKPGSEPLPPFTVLSEVVKKNTGKEPFAAPKALLDAHAAKRFGPYVDPYLGEVPVDFVSDLHITGGNSGSATLNARGELVGLVFDGNYEALASDWQFQPKITRSIHVDLRYLLWMLDAVDGGDHLVREMGATPAID